jgi:hypothetical protein
MQTTAVETIFTLARDLPAPDFDAGRVDPASLQSAALARGSIRRLCSLRKISEAGAILHCDTPLDVGETISLELMSGHTLRGIVNWSHGSSAGLRFDTPLDVFAVIARNLVNQAGERRRLPRVELAIELRIRARAGMEVATTRDISQGGAKIETGLALELDEPVDVTIDGLGSISGLVCWRDGRLAGISFAPELGWQQLMPWLRQVRDAGQRARPRTVAPTRRPDPSLPPEAQDLGESAVQLNIPARVREGNNRWKIDVASVTTRQVEFDSYAALRLGTLLWLALPGLEGWSARVVRMEGFRYTCEFTHPLHPAVLERMLAMARGEA